MAEKRVALYPLIKTGAGTGHIVRLLPFFNDSRFDAVIVNEDPEELRRVKNTWNLREDQTALLSEGPWDLVLLDHKETDLTLLERLMEQGPVVALDEGGKARDYVPYIIDILPNLEKSDANISNPGLLNLPDKKASHDRLKKILITFGGEDPKALTCSTAQWAENLGDVTCLLGPLYRGEKPLCKTLPPVANLKDILCEYDLIITSFGLTAFEGAAAGVPVLLRNPTEYHEALGKKAGFKSMGFGKPEKYTSLQDEYQKIKEATEKIDLGKPEKLTDLIYNLTLSEDGCALCGKKINPVIHRYRNKTYCVCESCRLPYMLRHQEEMVYSRDYFFKEYTNQYGKSYLEDFEHIKKMGYIRSDIIRKKIKSPRPVLVDIGCAYGPFLSAAATRGFIPRGIDISSDAVNWVKENLGYDAASVDFPREKLPFLEGEADVVTMWYVIEHFKNLHKVLKEVSRQLNRGGVFAFSTPNGRGISYKNSSKIFFKNSPDDHYTILSPKLTISLLKKYGFKVYKIRITGHHPERFKQKPKTGTIKWHISSLISRAWGLGDTFEVYAVKE